MPDPEKEEDQQIADETQSDVVAYVNSPMFRKRQENFLSQEYERLNPLQQGLQYLFGGGKEGYIENNADEFVREAREEVRELPRAKIKNIVGAKGQTGETDDGEIYIEINDRIPDDIKGSTVAHESRHAIFDMWSSADIDSKRPGDFDASAHAFSYGESTMPIEQARKEAGDDGWSARDDYEFKNHEIKAEVWGSRFQLEEDMEKIRKGEFDDFLPRNPYLNESTKKQIDQRREKLEVMQKWIKENDIKGPVQNEFNRNHLDILKTLRPDERLLNQFDDDVVLNLMNIIAQRQGDFAKKATRTT